MPHCPGLWASSSNNSKVSTCDYELRLSFCQVAPPHLLVYRHGQQLEELVRLVGVVTCDDLRWFHRNLRVVYKTCDKQNDIQYFKSKQLKINVHNIIKEHAVNG